MDPSNMVGKTSASQRTQSRADLCSLGKLLALRGLVSHRHHFQGCSLNDK